MKIQTNLASRVLVLAAVSLGTLLVACAEEDGSSLRNRPGAGGDGTEEEGAAPPPPTCTQAQKTYAGFGDTKLEIGRTESPVGQDRARLKSFTVLVDDYSRLLGKSPSVLAESGPTFGQPPPRWYEEPEPGAVLLYQAYRVGFEACLELTKTDPKYAAVPTDAAAKAECATLERKAWSRTPTTEEIQACADVAVKESLEETQPGGTTKKATDPRRRWAYACASVLTAPGFLTL